jgi:hypothetical protein
VLKGRDLIIIFDRFVGPKKGEELTIKYERDKIKVQSD